MPEIHHFLHLPLGIDPRRGFIGVYSSEIVIESHHKPTLLNPMKNA
jgi:hypothetical protein